MPLSYLKTVEAHEQMDTLLRWLRQHQADDDVRRRLVWPAFVVRAGTPVFRFQYGIDEQDLRRSMASRPAFFATTAEGAYGYQGKQMPLERRRRVLIRGEVRNGFVAAKADQAAIAKMIYIGAEVGPFGHLVPNRTYQETPVVFVQRWVVPIVMQRLLGRRLAGLFSLDLAEMTVAKPTASLELTFEWLDNPHRAR